MLSTERDRGESVPFSREVSERLVYRSRLPKIGAPAPSRRAKILRFSSGGGARSAIIIRTFQKPRAFRGPSERSSVRLPHQSQCVKATRLTAPNRCNVSSRSIRSRATARSTHCRLNRATGKAWPRFLPPAQKRASSSIRDPHWLSR
jgi:hypothetical protein